MAQTKSSQSHRPQWKSQWGFLLAAVGSAVGLGNIWRFPYLCYENGGGAFLIPYGVALVTAGIPLLILELGIGHKMRGSAPLSFFKIRPQWEWLGWWMVIFVMFGIVMYYAVIIAWCICYMGFSLTLAWGADSNTFFFQNFLGVTEGPHVIGDVRSPILFALLLVWGINWLVVFFGVQKGIEKANKVFMPMLFILLLSLVVWVGFLPGAGHGIAQYLKPDFSRLTDFKVWVDAYSQIFFSLSLAFGIMMAYASYLPRKADINRQACWIALMDSGLAFIAGMVVFGTLGYMTMKTGKPLDELVQHGIGLAFVAYPEAIGLLPNFSRLFGVLFFLALSVAGISSSISILEGFTSAVIDKFQYKRKVVVTVLSVVGFSGGIIFATGGGLSWLDIVDHFISHYGLVIACILQCIVIGWIYKAARFREHVNAISSFQLGKIFDLLIRYLIPGILLFLFLNDLIQDIRHPYGDYPFLSLLLIGRDWLLATFIAAWIVAMRPWRKASHI